MRVWFYWLVLLVALLFSSWAHANSDWAGFSVYIDGGQLEGADEHAYGVGFSFTGQNGIGVEAARRYLDERKVIFISFPGDGSPTVRDVVGGHLVSDALLLTYLQELRGGRASLTWKAGVHRWNDELFHVSETDAIAAVDFGYLFSQRWSGSLGGELLKLGTSTVWRTSIKLALHF